MPTFDELPSEGEMAVIYWSVVIMTTLGGIAAIIFSFKTDSVDTAIALRVVGVLALIVAALVIVGQKIVSWFLD